MAIGKSVCDIFSEELHSAYGNIEAEQTTEMQQHPFLNRKNRPHYSEAPTVPLKPLPALLIHMCIPPVRYIPNICYARSPPGISTGC